MDLTVREYSRVWLEGVSARAHPATVERYGREYRLHIDPFLGELALRDVGRPHLKALVARHCATGKSGMLLRVLGNLFASAVDDGYLETQPALNLWRHAPRPERVHQVKAFMREELSRFLAASETEPVYSDLFRTMALTGARSGEARALIASDVHERALDIIRTFSGNSLSASTKTRAARRIEIPSSLGELLGRRARSRSPGAWLFDRLRKGYPEPLQARAVSDAFRRIIRRAKLASHHGTHSLRHTYASHLISRGLPIAYVQAQLGHKSIQQTVDVYGRWLTPSRAEELERWAEDVEPTTPPMGLSRLASSRTSWNPRNRRVPRVVAYPRTSRSTTSPEDDDSEGAA